MSIFDNLANGGVLIDILRVCDLIKLNFSINEDIICLHIQSALMRGLKGDKLLISSNDIYMPSKHYKKKLFKKFKWDIPGDSFFDDQLNNFKENILNKKVRTISILDKDLILDFDDEYKIEILACTLETERELFRIFKKGDLDSHLVFET